MKKAITGKDVVFHGVTPFGLSLFTCYSLGLGSYQTDSRGRQARRDALQYFREKHAKDNK